MTLDPHRWLLAQKQYNSRHVDLLADNKRRNFDRDIELLELFIAAEEKARKKIANDQAKK